MGLSLVAAHPFIACVLGTFSSRFHLLIFRERGREGERDGEKHQCVVAFRAPPTGDLAHNPGMCPNWESNKRPFGSQAGTQSTEPHQPGPLLRPIAQEKKTPFKILLVGRGKKGYSPKAFGGSMALPVPHVQLLASGTVKEYISAVLSHLDCGNLLQKLGE